MIALYASTEAAMAAALSSGTFAGWKIDPPAQWPKIPAGTDLAIDLWPPATLGLAPWARLCWVRDNPDESLTETLFHALVMVATTTRDGKLLDPELCRALDEALIPGDLAEHPHLEQRFREGKKYAKEDFPTREIPAHCLP